MNVKIIVRVIRKRQQTFTVGYVLTMELLIKQNASRKGWRGRGIRLLALCAELRCC